MLFKQLKCSIFISTANNAKLWRLRLVRINTIFQHSEKYRHPWELPATPSFRGLIHELNELNIRKQEIHVGVGSR